MSHAHQELLQFLPSGGGDILEHSLAFLLSRGETIFSFFLLLLHFILKSAKYAYFYLQ